MTNLTNQPPRCSEAEKGEIKTLKYKFTAAYENGYLTMKDDYNDLQYYFNHIKKEDCVTEGHKAQYGDNEWKLKNLLESFPVQREAVTEVFDNIVELCKKTARTDEEISKCNYKFNEELDKEKMYSDYNEFNHYNLYNFMEECLASKNPVHQEL